MHPRWPNATTGHLSLTDRSVFNTARMETLELDNLMEAAMGESWSGCETGPRKPGGMRRRRELGERRRTAVAVDYARFWMSHDVRYIEPRPAFTNR